jgi:hypothetical protein
VHAQNACYELFNRTAKTIHNFALPVDERLQFSKFFNKLNSIKYKNNSGVVFDNAGLVDGLPVVMATLNPVSNPHPKRVLITAGVHGSEVMGVKNAVYLFEQLISNISLREKFEITFVFNINNSGLKAGTRTTDDKVDLNRIWTDQGSHATIQTILKKLNQKYQSKKNKVDLDLFIDLHDAYSREKYFIIKSEPQENLLERSVSTMPSDYFIESHSGNYPEKFSSTFKVDAYELLAPGVTTSMNEGTFKTYWYKKGVKNSYTFESPGKIDKNENVKTSAKILTRILEQF